MIAMAEEADRPRFQATVKREDYGIALSQALTVIQLAHPIVAAAIERGHVKFLDVEAYLGELSLLQETCGCKGLQSSVFLNEAADSWEYEET